jgi:hypothetical protein
METRTLRHGERLVKRMDGQLDSDIEMLGWSDSIFVLALHSSRKASKTEEILVRGSCTL